MTAADFVDTFDRADGPLGVTSSGARPWRVDTGSGSVVSGRAVVSGLASVDAEAPDLDVSLAVDAGGALAFRIVDSSSYWRVAFERYTATVTRTTSYTTWLWTGQYAADEHQADLRHAAFTYSVRGETSAVLPASRTQTHGHSGGGSLLHSHSFLLYRPTITQSAPQTETRTTTSTETRYRAVLIRRVGGVESRLREIAVPSGARTTFRVVTRADGAITASAGTSTVAAVVDPALVSATRVGVIGSADLLSVVVLSRPPLAPSGLTVSPNPADTGLPTVLSWTHQGQGLPQTAFRLAYRRVGGVWTTVDGIGAASSHTLPAGTLTAGDYEWTVGTSNAVGAGPDSPVAFFTAATAPSAPTITSPLSTITTSDVTVAWSSSAQDAYEVRVVADAAGAPGAVLSTSGTVVSADRTRLVSGLVNGTTVHVQVRVRASGLWSGWASVRLGVVYAPPVPPRHRLRVTRPFPQLTVIADTGSSAGYAPTYGPTYGPGGSSGAPPASHVDVYRRPAGSDSPGVRMAVGLALGVTWTDPYVAHRESVEYALLAHASNGTSALGPWTTQADVIVDEPVTVLPDAAEGDFADADFLPADFA